MLTNSCGVLERNSVNTPANRGSGIGRAHQPIGAGLQLVEIDKPALLGLQLESAGIA